MIVKSSDIPKHTLIPTGDMLFDFTLVSKHIQTDSDALPSYVDYGFGSEKMKFAGSHRFAIDRKERTHEQDVDEKLGEVGKEEGYIELSVECFTCNPVVNRDSWAVYIPWVHYWYAKFLWADAVKAVLRRR